MIFPTRGIVRVILCATILVGLGTATAREPQQAKLDNDATAAFSAAIQNGNASTNFRELLLTGAATKPASGRSVANFNRARNRGFSRQRGLPSTRARTSAGRSAVPAALPRLQYNLRAMSAAGRGSSSSPRVLGRRSISTLQPDIDALVTGNNGTLRMLRRKPGAGGNRAGAKATSFAAVASSFIATNEDLFGLEKSERELLLKRDWTDSSGRSHAVFQRMLKGLPVMHEEIAVHGTGADVYFVNARYDKLAVAADSSAKLTGDEAWELALQHLSADPSSVQQESDPVLKIFAWEGAYHYVHEVEVPLSDLLTWRVLVDAGSGKILDARNNVRTQLVDASGTDALGARRNFTAWQEGQAFYLLDPSIPTPDATYDPVNHTNPRGDQLLGDARNAGSPDFPYPPLYFSTSSSRNSGWDPVGVSVFANTRQTYDYFLNTHGRHSIDGQGMNLFSIIHYGQNFQQCLLAPWFHGVR